MITALQLADASTGTFESIQQTQGSTVAEDLASFSTFAWIYGGLMVASSIVSGIHGYKRHNGNLGAGLGWGALGFFFPIITPAVAFAEGYGEPIKR